MEKLVISDLKIGDKLFIIDTLDLTLDIAEVIELAHPLVKVQCYLHTNTLYLWRFLPNKSHVENLIIFTDENEAIEEFKSILKYNQDGRNR